MCQPVLVLPHSTHNFRTACNKSFVWARERGYLERGFTIVQRETFEGENFRKFRGFVAIRKSFLCEIWGCGVLWWHFSAKFGGVASFGGTIGSTSEQSAKVFSVKILFSSNLRTFSRKKFPANKLKNFCRYKYTLPPNEALHVPSLSVLMATGVDSFHIPDQTSPKLP